MAWLSCSHVSLVRPRGGETLGFSQIRSLKSLHWKVGMTAIALLSLALLQRCRSLSSQWEVPLHLYSHLQGTFLDEVHERVDAYAKGGAL